ncbi:unnamed protein product [Rotaria sordida]|uniref:G-protein coupled receptors family 1 profile domain-containing protein n=1 Tax=Rotaria sordida TaxID=392033 RepID=A0A813NCZ4_9BILA|nr:unnamed protein product [Rotaria sordida]CAF0911037.1 unnamed protein product [Rotaria sordida]
MNNTEKINLLTNELELMRERYLKFVDVHGQLQMQNSLLEERVLSIVETYSNEKNHLEQSLFDAKQEILCLKETIEELQNEKQRYKDDCNLAVRLLHRYPNDFMSTTSGQMQEQIKNRFESTSANQYIPSQHSVLIPTFPPTFVAPHSLLTTTTITPSNNTQTMSTIATTNDSLRLAAETLFKSNSVLRSPLTQFICSDCHRTVKRCDVSVQTSLDNNTNDNATSRLRLVSLTSSDDVQCVNYVFLLFIQWEIHDSSCRWRGYFGYMAVAAVLYSYLAQATSRFFISILSAKYSWIVSFKTHIILICIQWIIVLLIPLPALLTNHIYYRPFALCWVPRKFTLHVIYTVVAYYLIPAILIFAIHIYIYVCIKHPKYRVFMMTTTRQSNRDLEVLRNIMILFAIYTLGAIPTILYILTNIHILYGIGIVTVSLTVAIEKIATLILDRDIRNIIKLYFHRSMTQIRPIS